MEEDYFTRCMEAFAIHNKEETTVQRNSIMKFGITNLIYHLNSQKSAIAILPFWSTKTTHSTHKTIGYTLHYKKNNNKSLAKLEYRCATKM